MSIVERIEKYVEESMDETLHIEEREFALQRAEYYIIAYIGGEE